LFASQQPAQLLRVHRAVCDVLPHAGIVETTNSVKPKRNAARNNQEGESFIVGTFFSARTTGLSD
jgi:hypothetical protein